jgi:hypothetical protein
LIFKDHIARIAVAGALSFSFEALPTAVWCLVALWLVNRNLCMSGSRVAMHGIYSHLTQNLANWREHAYSTLPFPACVATSRWLPTINHVLVKSFQLRLNGMLLILQSSAAQ